MWYTAIKFKNSLEIKTLRLLLLTTLCSMMQLLNQVFLPSKRKFNISHVKFTFPWKNTAETKISSNYNIVLRLLLGVFKLQPASKNTFSFQMAWVVLKSFDTKYNKLLLFYTTYSVMD